MQIDTKARNNPRKIEVSQGFIGGLNTFQDQNLIKENELTDAKNVELQVDGIVPRRGTTPEGNSSGTKTYGLYGYYKADGTRKFLRVNNQKLEYLNGATWTQIGSTAFSNVKTVMVQAINNIYFFDGTNDLRKYDGTTISTYTAVGTPVGLAHTTGGTSGTTVYSYKVSAFNASGESLPSATYTVSDGNAVLSTTNKNILTWTATAGAVGYNIWGNKATGLGQTYMATVYTNTYTDDGSATPSIVILPPEGDTSAGIKGKYACFAISRLFVAGNPGDPSRLYWGGVGTNIANFSGDINGGGSTPVFQNDGYAIKAIIPFQGGVIVGKENAIYKFTFNSEGNPQLEEITRSFGMISHYATMAVENDIVFPARKDGRLAFYSLGNQENYAASILRTNELSIKVAQSLQDVNLAQLENSAGGYFNNLYMCSMPKEDSTENNRTWVLDTRFGSWVYWEGITPNVMSQYIDSNGNQDFFYGHSTDGYVYKMFQNDRNDNNVAIDVKWVTKSYDQGVFHRFKQFFFPTFQFKDISSFGSISGDIIVDGTIVSSEFAVNSYVAGGLGFGAMMFGQVLFGDATGGSPASGASSDQLVEVQKRLKARSIKYSFGSNTNNLYYKFLSLAHEYSILEGKRLPSSFKVY